MPRNILLTSLDALENDRVLRYYAVQNEFGFDYCEAAQRMEASAEYILSRFPVDEILVLGGDMPSENRDEKKSRRLKDVSALFSADQETLSAFDLYRSRIAQYNEVGN